MSKTIPQLKQELESIKDNIEKNDTKYMLLRVAEVYGYKDTKDMTFKELKDAYVYVTKIKDSGGQNG